MIHLDDLTETEKALMGTVVEALPCTVKWAEHLDSIFPAGDHA